MHLILLIISGILLVATVPAFFLRDGDNVVRSPKIALLVPILGGGSGLAINLICLLQAASRIAAVLSACFLLVGALALLAYYRKKITYDNDTFEVHRLLGRRKHYRMEEVEGITEGHGVTVFHLHDERRIRFEGSKEKMQQFIAELDTVYSKVLHKGIALPDVPTRLFHGYVKNPGEFVLVFVVVLLFCLASMVLIFCFSRSTVPLSEQEKVTITEYAVVWEEDALKIVTSELRQPYNISYLEDALSEEQLSELKYSLDSGSSVTVAVEQTNLEKARNNQCNFITILEMTDEEGRVLISRDAAQAAKQATFRPIFIALGVVLVLTILFELWICYILNHAPQHPVLYKLFVKKDARNL